MTIAKSNSEQLHEAGIINKKDLSQESIQTIDSLSQEEVGHLKVSNLSKKKVSNTAGIVL